MRLKLLEKLDWNISKLKYIIYEFPLLYKVYFIYDI